MCISCLSDRASALAVAAGHAFNAQEAAQDGDYDVLFDETIETLDSLEGCQAMMEDDEPDALPLIELGIDNCESILAALNDDEDPNLSAMEKTLRLTGQLCIGMGNATTNGNWDEFIGQLSSTIPAILAANSCMVEAADCTEAIWPNEELLEVVDNVLCENSNLIDSMLQNIDLLEMTDATPASILLGGAESLLALHKDIEFDVVNYGDEELDAVRDSIHAALTAQLYAAYAVYHPEGDLDLDIFSWDYITGRCDEAVV